MGSSKEQIEKELRLPQSVNEFYNVRLLGESPQHRVRITKPYRLGATEVTQEQYRRVTGSSPSEFQGDPRRPVERVSWLDAVEFCRKLSELPEEKAATRRYALPTEAQWEYACRAGSAALLQSAVEPLARAEEERKLYDFGWFGPNAGGCTHPVAQKLASAFKLYDMYGNVEEWCADWYAPDYYAKSPADDPAGPTSGSDRSVRGGSWYHPLRASRVTARTFSAPGTKAPELGFRVVQVLPE